MKIVIQLIIFILILLIVGCNNNPVQEYGTTLSNSLKKSQDVALQSELSSLKKSIQAFCEEKGRLPLGIEELERFINREIDREKFYYNPETGEISVR